MSIHFSNRIESKLLAKLRDLYFKKFGSVWPDQREYVGQAPGRIEIIGNHVDHQGGVSICANLNKFVSCYAVTNNTDVINFDMGEFGECSININDLDKKSNELGSSTAIVRGMCAAFNNNGFRPVGFNAVLISDIPVGVGVSSSAAFEVLVGAILYRTTDAHLKDNVQPLLKLALSAADVERNYYGKMCGDQDQIACSYDGIIGIEYSPNIPVVMSFDFNIRTPLSKYKFVMIDSKTDHSNCDDEYAAVPQDMFKVAELFGKKRLIDVGEEVFYADKERVLSELGQYPTLRAEHFFEEVRRVEDVLLSLRYGSLKNFTKNLRESGQSSLKKNRNVAPSFADETYLPFKIYDLCEKLLSNKDAAWRVHGGGFGGAILAVVPVDYCDEFVKLVNEELKDDACTVIELGTTGVWSNELK